MAAPVRLVRQQDTAGCLVACLAMVTGRTYADVRAWFVGCDFDRGITHLDVESYLAEHGHKYALKYRWLPGSTDRAPRRREPWPPAPYAPAHIVSIRGGQHGVVWLPDGTVLDPLQDAPRSLREFSDAIAYVLGVWA